jgi:hypothetical protein
MQLTVKLRQATSFIRSNGGWRWDCVSGVDSNRRTIFVADVHRCDGNRFIVRAYEKLTEFVELHAGVVSTY